MLIERNVDGIRICERPGSGSTIFCLHGIGSTARSFDQLIASMPIDWRVLCWNAPGYLGSTRLGVDWPIAADYAERLREIIKRMELDRIKLIGHSLGALMAAAFAVRHPHALSHLVLMSCARGHETLRNGPLSDAVQRRLSDIETLGVERFADKRAPGLVHDPEHNLSVVQQVYQGMRQVDPAGYRSAACMLSTGRLLDDVRQLTTPTYVLVGEHDTITPVSENRAVYQALPDAARQGFAIVPNCGHAVYQQAPSSCAHILAEAFSGGTNE